MDGKRRQFGPTPGSDVVNDVERLRPWLDVLGCPDCVWGSDHGHSGSLLIASDGLVCAGSMQAPGPFGAPASVPPAADTSSSVSSQMRSTRRCGRQAT